MKFTVISAYVLIPFKVFSPDFIFWLAYIILSMVSIRFLINFGRNLIKQWISVKRFEGFYINYAAFYLKKRRDFLKNCVILLLSLGIQIYIFKFAIEAAMLSYTVIAWFILIGMGILFLVICIFKFQGSLFMTIVITFSNMVVMMLIVFALAYLITDLGGEDKNKYMGEVLAYILSWGNAIEVLCLAAIAALFFQILVIISRPPSALDTTKSALKIVNITSTIILVFILLYLNPLSESLYFYATDLNSEAFTKALNNLQVKNVNEFIEILKKIITLILLPFTSGNAIATFVVDYIDQKYKKRSKKDYLKGFQYFIEDGDLNRASIYFKKSVYYGGGIYEIQLRTNSLLLHSIESLMTEDRLETRLKRYMAWFVKQLGELWDIIFSIYHAFSYGIRKIISEIRDTQNYVKSEWQQGRKLKVILKLASLMFILLLATSIYILLVSHQFFIDTQLALSEQMIKFLEGHLSDQIKGILLWIFVFLTTFVIIIFNIMDISINTKKYKSWDKFLFITLKISIILFFVSLGLLILFQASKYGFIEILFPLALILLIFINVTSKLLKKYNND